MIREEETPEQSAPRSPFNTGSMDITTAGGTKSLCGHSLVAEKTVVVVRHGMTTWNEQQRIQASTCIAPKYITLVGATCWSSGTQHIETVAQYAMESPLGNVLQGSSDGSELSLHGQAQAVRCRDALSRMQIDR